jgi:hypothetical protein
MIQDYYTIKDEYEAIKGKEVREEYVKDRKNIVQEIEKVCSFGCIKSLSDMYIACYSLREMVKKSIPGPVL